MATAILPHLPQDAECILEGLVDKAWVRVETLRLAKNAVKTDIRDKGLRLKDYEAKEITILAERWFSDHRAELIGHATVALVLRDCWKNARKSNSRAKQREEIHG
jgi:hypothetical protein